MYKSIYIQGNFDYDSEPEWEDDIIDDDDHYEENNLD